MAALHPPREAVRLPAGNGPGRARRVRPHGRGVPGRLARFDEAARRTAVEFLADPTIADLVDALPISAGQRILAVGDSITDGLESWAEILRRLLAVRRADDEITVINAGLSAHTSAMVLRRWPATVTGARPDVIICGLGGNDVTRGGPDATKPVVSIAEPVVDLWSAFGTPPDPALLRGRRRPPDPDRSMRHHIGPAPHLGRPAILSSRWHASSR